MTDIKETQMRVNTNENRVLIDVDKTLITNIETESLNGDDVKLNYYGQTVYVKTIDKHIDLLKSYKARGYEVIVNSANGFLWAKEVVTKLKLTQYVDEVATKPSKYVDDKDANTWMQRVYIE
jgi:beta-phosphoglucomutase-like phosphatase (HAD superfamily)